MVMVVNTNKPDSLARDGIRAKRVRVQVKERTMDEDNPSDQ